MHTLAPVTILDAAAANGHGKPVFVADYDHLILALNSANNADLTTRAKGSIKEDAPDFASAAGPDNQWDFVQLRDLEDASALGGDEGLVLSGVDDQRMFEVNVNMLRWFTLEVSSYVAGNITAVLTARNNS